MCAIAGVFNRTCGPVQLRMVRAMNKAQAHRGPDGEGIVLLDPRGKERPCEIRGNASRPHGYSLAFGHRRLAIVDLSPLGHQPMATDDQHCWVTYNGEIYNYLELRDELKKKGYRFRSASDTEVLLAAYCEWGENCITRFNGMFAFALWDGDRRRLFCARDRMGVKPFYYSWDGDRFIFASEIKALLAAGIPAKPNPRAIFDYLEGAYLDYSEATFFDGIQQLPPAHHLMLDGGSFTLRRYWDLPAEGVTDRLSMSEGAEHFQDLFRDAIRLRLRSDVPIGTCLSGGLDSSSIVCVANKLMFQDQSLSRDVVGDRQKTFSSCFEDPAYDERRFIRPVVDLTGAATHYTFPDAKELAERAMQLVWQQDEPFGSTSIFAQWNVMRSAAEHGVKVLLDGQGADELLAGYHGFFGAHFADLLEDRQWFTLLREVFGYRRLHGPLPPHVSANLARALLPQRLVRFVRSRMTGSIDWISPEFRRQWGPMPVPQRNGKSHVQQMQHQLLTQNGIRALLHYEDRNSMAFGIETRLPFLDYRIVEFLYRLDERLKIRQGWTKAILRKAMEGILPEEVRCRVDKMGFITPEDLWFRNGLRAWALEILIDPRTRARGYLNVDAALQEFHAHVAEQKNISFTIWRWINLELWCRQFLDQPCAEFLS